MNFSLSRFLLRSSAGICLLALLLPSPVRATTAADAQLEQSLPAGVEDALKLTRAGLSEDVILAQIRSTGASVSLTGDQIIFLTNAGVSQNVLQTLIASKPPAAAVEASSPPVPSTASPVMVAPPAQVSSALFVPARQPWVNTNIDVAAGQQVMISASGRVGYGRRERDHVSPNGNPGLSTYFDGRSEPFLAPNQMAESLIGRIGPFGAPFEVGSAASFVAPAGGRLFLSINDNNFTDNSGAWAVTVTLPQPVAAAAPPATVDFNYFHNQLAPYGNWIQVAGYGWCWNPQMAMADAGWRPYLDGGQWVCTDGGWFWQSEYPWGDIAFHYGRWFRDPAYGWLWVPDYTWGPSWVAWRHAEADAACGWAPLPPGTLFVEGQGIFFHGRLVVDADFGLPAASFVFVGYDHFLDGGYRRLGFTGERAAFLYRRSIFVPGYRLEQGRVVFRGVDRERVVHFTHREVHVVDVHQVRRTEERTHFDARQHRPPPRK
ncbi:MAG TPA: DUF6600 domain-containing protein [Opitutaceae bacterium]|jgi:hypothetical protein|nr:DUF6600 domain-containing protein [Opitutaceae bacterium]